MEGGSGRAQQHGRLDFASVGVPLPLLFRHCERSEAIQCSVEEMDCFVASLLAMTDWRSEHGGRQKAGTTPSFSIARHFFALQL